eukprot:Amastigsp_a2882_39.p1 type:complete len:394 gc:universal Amastigsp_a2882_39:196-1377(+)
MALQRISAAAGVLSELGLDRCRSGGARRCLWQCRIVGVPDRPRGVECSPVGFVERRPCGQSLDEIRIRNERNTEAHTVGVARRHRVEGHLAGVLVVDDDGAAKERAHAGKVEPVEAPRRTRLALDKMHKRDAACVELAEQSPVGLLRGRVKHSPVCIRDGAETDPDAISAKDRRARVDDCERHPKAVCDRAAELVRALVARVADEALEQVVVRAVNLDAVKACTLGNQCCVPELADGLPHLLRGHRLRSHARHFVAAGDVEEPPGVHRRGRQREAAGDERMRDGTHVPELRDDLAALAVHSLCDRAPAGLVRVGETPRGAEVALALCAHLRAFGHNEPGTCALLVVSDIECVRGVCDGRCSHARERCHDDSIRALDRSYSDGSEQRRCSRGRH